MDLGIACLMSSQAGRSQSSSKKELDFFGFADGMMTMIAHMPTLAIMPIAKVIKRRVHE